MKLDSKCGLCGIYPKWLQYFATTHAFIVIYGVLGTVQAMAFIYIGVSLTTLEKRFKIPSQTTGILLSGNEISQVLSVILIYYGGAGHRPRWIAIGVACSALSCLILTLPHFIYGPGQEALSLTHEFLNSTISSSGVSRKNDFPICSSNTSRPDTCEEDDSSDTSIVPRLLIFCSQFILGIGTSLYYGLGQTYMDDNTKKKNIPMLLGITFSLRTIGPVLGFVLSYFCLRIYIDPTLHPIIDDEDPRWLGAWWLGWIILGVLMALSAILLAMFPHELKKPKSNKKKVHLSESEVPLKSTNLESQVPPMEKPTLTDFVVSTKRIMKNKLFMYNVVSGVFYILGSAPFIYFIGKYLEVEYGTSSGGGTIIAGPLKLLGVVLGFLISGIVIDRYKPSPRPLLSWNVISGVAYVISRILYIYIKCDAVRIQGVDLETMELNLTASCNVNCNCEQVKFAPVCHESSGMTFFSACHAGCQRMINDTAFGNCNCVASLDRGIGDAILNATSLHMADQFSKTLGEVKNVVTVGPCKADCFKPYMIFSVLSAFGWILGCSGRIGNVLMSYRCVEPRDKSLAQGVAMMLLSLIALIPAPIIAGALMDSTCLIWDHSCKDKGNCWIYHKDNFNWVINSSGAALCSVGVIFEGLVCYYSKGLDFYGEEEEAEKRRIAEMKKNDTTNTEVTLAKP